MFNFRQLREMTVVARYAVAFCLIYEAFNATPNSKRPPENKGPGLLRHVYEMRLLRTGTKSFLPLRTVTDLVGKLSLPRFVLGCRIKGEDI